VKIKNGRVPAFPDFIMSWVNDQLNELINALFTAPNLIVVLPGAVGSNMQFDGNWQNFQKNSPMPIVLSHSKISRHRCDKRITQTTLPIDKDNLMN
jgi:hypothetical protein